MKTQLEIYKALVFGHVLTAHGSLCRVNPETGWLEMSQDACEWVRTSLYFSCPEDYFIVSQSPDIQYGKVDITAEAFDEEPEFNLEVFVRGADFLDFKIEARERGISVRELFRQVTDNLKKEEV